MMTGKNKKHFENYILEYHYDNSGIYYVTDGCDDLDNVFGNLRYFELLPFELQKGVYEAYYDSLDLPVETYRFFNNGNPYFRFLVSESLGVKQFNTRLEASEEALKKADQLRNRKLSPPCAKV